MTKSPRAMPEVDRAAANRAAIEARRARAAVKAKLRSGELSPLKALADSRTPGAPVGTIRVIDFLQTFPSIGETKAAKLLEQLRISPRKRLSGLGVHQLERLEHFVRQRAGVSAVSSKPSLTVLAGPTAVGKGTVASHVRQHYPHIRHSVSVTTRPARPGEIHGVHYLFVDDETFDRLLTQDELLEWATVHNSHRYGTPKGPVLESSARGESMLLEIDLQGARQVRANMPDARLVFLAPPSWEELVTRLVGRGTEGEEERTRRLETAKVELAAADEFDVVIVNDEVAHAAAQLVALILGEEDGTYSPQM